MKFLHTQSGAALNRASQNPIGGNMEKRNKQDPQEKQIYGIRKCLNCKTAFEAKWPSQVTCSVKCAGERRKTLKRKKDVRYRQKRKAYLLELLAELNHADNELLWLNCQYESLLYAAPMNHDLANGKLAPGIYYQLKNAEAQIKGLESELDRLKEDASQSTGLKNSLAKEQERNAQLLEETARLKEEICRMVKENERSVRELREKLAYAEKQVAESHATSTDQPEKPEETKAQEPVKHEIETPIPKDGGYDLRCWECGKKFWSRNKEEKFCCPDCFLADKNRRRKEAADAKGYPAKKDRKNK